MFRATMEVVMEAFGMKKSDFSLASELKGSGQRATMEVVISMRT